MVKKKLKILYIVVIFVVMALPALGTALYRVGAFCQEGQTEFSASREGQTEFPASRKEKKESPVLREEQKEFPVLWEEDGWNKEFLSQAGAYFETHFAGRQEILTAYAKLNKAIFLVSSNDSIITGTDGWLYYSDSLENYLGTELLSEREIFNIAASLRLMQDYVQQRGGSFLFAPVLNKNTLYGSHMPFYYQLRTGKTGNLERLLNRLEEMDVSCIDLRPLYEGTQETLYHRTDSHWNNRGAALACQAMMEALGRESIPWDQGETEIWKDFTGDLAEMLYPADPGTEEEIYFQREKGYSYLGDTESNFEPKIWTQSTGGKGSLVMYRDSFGNALLPFAAEEFAVSYFTRGEPFLMNETDTYLADTVIIERAERFLPKLAENAAVMEAPWCPAAFLDREADGVFQIFGEEVDTEPSGGLQNLSCRQMGEWMVLEGTLDGSILPEEALIWVRLDGEAVYEAFPVTVLENGKRNPWGFRIYLPGSLFWEETGEPRKVQAEIITADSASEEIPQGIWLLPEMLEELQPSEEVFG